MVVASGTSDILFNNLITEEPIPDKQTRSKLSRKAKQLPKPKPKPQPLYVPYALLSQKRSADGSFRMIAHQAGRVLHDKFIAGEYVEAGYELMVISDESTMWVEARVTPDVASKIKVGNNAEIIINKKRLPAKVIQLHHTLDETTRTSAVRIEVANERDQLHAGMFVTAVISTSNKSQSMQLPEAAVLRSSDGDWQIMVEQDKAGEFKAVEVEVIQISDGKAIIEGIKPGSRVVTQGAFFVQSELAKSGFEIHNH